MQATMSVQPKAETPTTVMSRARAAFGLSTQPQQQYVTMPFGELQSDEDFFSTVTGNHHEREVAMSQIEVMSMDDLPSVGIEDVVYSITSTLDQYKWSSGNYTSHNPYRSVDEHSRLLIVDESAYMPHGGAISTRVIYNIWALRADLALLSRQGLAYEDVLPKGSCTSFDDAAKIRHKYMLHNHKALVNLLRENVLVKGQINTDLLDRVAKLGVDIWIGDAATIGFKDGTFVVLV